MSILTQNADKVQDRAVPAGITDDPPSIPVDGRQIGFGNPQRVQLGVFPDLVCWDEHPVGGMARGDRVERVADDAGSDGGFDTVGPCIERQVWANGYVNGWTRRSKGMIVGGLADDHVSSVYLARARGYGSCLGILQEPRRKIEM